MNQCKKDSLLADIEERFTYHPVMTEQRRQRHEAINEAAKKFAEIVLLLGDEQCIAQFLMLVQQARMIANQDVTIQELNQQEEKICGSNCSI